VGTETATVSGNVGELGDESLRERVGEQRRTVGVHHASHRLLTEVATSVLPLVVLVLEHSSIGRLTLDGRVVRYPIPTGGSNPLGITVGGDGNLWFTENVTGGIGRLNPTTGVITEFPAPNPTDGITLGPDGNIWFADFSNVIFRITPVGVETAFPLGTGGITSLPDDVVFDAQGRLLFTEDATNAQSPEYVGRLDIHDGEITRFYLPAGRALPLGITIAGSEHNIWFTEYDAGKIGRMLATPTALR
jgi:virginiamycin B lyase